jgi:hypothetical protein
MSMLTLVSKTLLSLYRLSRNKMPLKQVIETIRMILYYLFNTLALLVLSITPAPALTLATAAAAAARYGFFSPSSYPLT